MRRHCIPFVLAAVLTFTASGAEEIPDLEKAIPAPVKALAEPSMTGFPGGIQMAVSAATETAQAHVLQGMNHLHGGWDFEASRHFAAAMREDPECLLAHWGMVMCLLNPTPETDEARVASTERMLSLIEQGKGTELERGYAYGLVKYIEEGPLSAADAFRKVSARFPNDMQAAVLAAVFSRSGFDDAGDATPDQERAEKTLMALIEKYPQSPVPLNALLFIHAEAPDLADKLWLARRLTQMAPDYPPFAHIAGHYEWRCGHYALASSAFGRAATLYQNWMGEQKVTIADCPEWVKAECYRIVALASHGDADTALAAARKLAATPLIDARPASSGNRLLLWEARSLPARLLMRSGPRDHSKEAASALPKPADIRKFHNHCMAYWWLDGLRFVLDARRLLNEHNLSGARDVLTAFDQHREMMEREKNLAATEGELSFWKRSLDGLEMLSGELRGDLAMAGPPEGRGIAYNWFSSAADLQHPATLLMPPVILTPMAARLAAFQMNEKKPADAIEAYQRALAVFPNDPASLTGLKTACEAAGKAAEAAEISKKIESLKSE